MATRRERATSLDMSEAEMVRARRDTLVLLTRIAEAVSPRPTVLDRPTRAGLELDEELRRLLDAEYDALWARARELGR